MNFPSELKYTKDHEWVRVEGNVATIGITDFAQKEADIKVRLDDIKQAQLAYKEFYGEYCPTMDSLIYFVHNGKKMKIKKEGAVPDDRLKPEEIAYLYGDNRPADFKMTEIEATALSKWPNNKRTE